MTISNDISTITYPVMEHFYTLQGEGAFAGHAAYFIRLGGCDVGCHWCDVKESWDASQHPIMSIGEILQEVQQYPGSIVVVTGGEPTMHDLQPLTSALHAIGKRTHIETSLSSPLTGDWDWITLSPKKFKAPLDEDLSKVHELKVVVFHKSDVDWAETYAQKMSAHCKLYLQAEWDKRELISPLIIDYIQNHPKWHLSMQTHKYLHIP